MCSGLPRELVCQHVWTGWADYFLPLGLLRRWTGFRPQSGLEFPPADNKAPREHLNRMNSKKKKALSEVSNRAETESIGRKEGGKK
jgi:hypothetical protein